MKLLFKASLLCLITLSIFSCGKDTGGLEIIIHSPQENATFNMGDTITLSYTVKDDIDITTIAWDTKSEFGTGSVVGAELLETITEYSGDFLIVADANIGTYEIDVIATGEDFSNVLSESVTINIQ